MEKLETTDANRFLSAEKWETDPGNLTEYISGAFPVKLRGWDTDTHSPSFRFGDAYASHVRQPCLTNSKFNNGAQCQGGIAVAIAKMRLLIDRCMLGDPPCVRTVEKGGEECVALGNANDNPGVSQSAVDYKKISENCVHYGSDREACINSKFCHVNDATGRCETHKSFL